MEKKSTSWGWIVFWLIFFWPAGLYLLVKKTTTDKSALMSGKTKGLSILGWTITILMGIVLFTTITDNVDDGFSSGFLAFLMFLGGILLIRRSKHIKKTSKKYKKYINMVINQNISNLDTIASALAIPYDEVVIDLEKMIDLGFLPNFYLNKGIRELCSNRPIDYGTKTTQQRTNVPVQPMQSTKEIQTNSTQCSSCGANNIVVVGQVTECEYCGNPING